VTPNTRRAETDWFKRDLGDLRAEATRAAKIGVAGQVATLVLGTVSMAVLSRMLNPDDVGLFALASSIVALLSVALETGFPYSLMQRDGLNHEQASAYFWFMLMLSVAAAAVGCAAAIPAGWIFGRPEVASIVAVLSLGLPVTTVGMTHSVILRRNMRQGAMVISGIVASILSIGSATAAAVIGWDWWALVIQALVLSASKCALWWWFCSWRPGPPRRGSGIRQVIAIGSTWSSSEISGLIRRSADQLILGWWWGADVVGIYSRGVVLSSLLFTQGIVPIMSAVWPALVRIHGDRERLHGALLKVADVIFFVAVPASAFLILAADPVVLLMLGKKWVACVSIMQISLLGLASVSTIGSVASLYASATGNVRAISRTAWVALPMSIFGITATLPLGAVAVASALAGVTALTSWLALRSALSGSGLDATTVCHRLIPPLIHSLVASAASSVALEWLTSGWPPAIRAIGAGLVMVAVYAGGWCMTARGRTHVRQMLEVGLGSPGIRIAHVIWGRS
jgi:PST family polysaccharide transporter